MDYISDISSLYEEIMLLEFSDAAIRKIAAKFSNDASEEDVRRELADFEKYKAKIDKKDPFQYKTWIELTEVIHAAKKESEEKKDFKKANVEGVANADDIVADDENVTIYKGDSQDKCVVYGRGYDFCISKQVGGNMFGSYRLGKESTFYFIFFKKKSPQENDHIMVLDHTRNGYEWTFKDNNTKPVKGGWDEIVRSYPELTKYKDLLSNKKLTEEERVFTQRLEAFVRKPSLQAFKEFTYKEQAQVLKSIINLPDEIWNVLDSTLRNEFISIGPNLTERQADNLKPNEVARYKKTRALSFDQLSKSGFLKINKYEDINQIVASPKAAYKYAEDILEWQNVPDEIIRSIASDPEYAYRYADDIVAWQNIPDEIIKSIASDADTAYRYAEDILEWRNVPDEIMKSITSNADTRYRYVRVVLRWQNVPDEIMKSITSSPKYAYLYARDVQRWQNVPDEIMKSITSSPKYAYAYAGDVLKGQNVPDEIIRSIASDPEYAYEYAEQILFWENVPDVIMKSITSDADTAYEYANNILEWRNVPDEIIKKIVPYPVYARNYAKKVLKGQNVPDEIIKSMASDVNEAFDYAVYQFENGRNVPDEIIQSIASDAFYAHLYTYGYLKWQNVPKEIIKAIQDSGEEIPPETTIKENTNRIPTNFNQLFERVCFLKDL